MKKTLVAYFSATETTRGLAENLATAINADLFRIVPAREYTPDDLDWTKKTSRTSMEMKDKSCRPEIAARVPNIEKYDVIFVGFPVWWYREPSIIDTFIESYDFVGKTIVPFATSGGSSIGDATKNIRELAIGANVVAGNRLDTNLTPEELRRWAENWIK